MANKNIKMLKCFFEVMKGNKEETDKVIPNMYAKDIYSIDYKFLKKHGLNNLIFDIDNTIMEVNSISVDDKLIDFFKSLEKQKFNICIMSNNGRERVLPVARALETDYMFKAQKPTPHSFNKALTILNSKKETTAMIGDQMLTDVKGANDFGIYSILVEPVSNKYDIKTGTSRILQNIMTKKLEKQDKFKRNSYYKERREIL